MMRPWLTGVATLRYSSAVNIVWDGNSIQAGTGLGVGEVTASRVMALAPIAGSGATSSNVAVAGQTIRQMNGLDLGSAADVTSAFASGKKNILVIWEWRNSTWGNANSAARTAAQSLQDMRDYIAARRSAQAWHAVVMLTSLPSSGTTAQADTIDEINSYIRQYYRDMGADLLVDVQQSGSPFSFRGDVPLNFQLTQQYWQETSTWTHLSAAGHAVIAPMVSAAMRRIKA